MGNRPIAPQRKTEIECKRGLMAVISYAAFCARQARGP